MREQVLARLGLSVVGSVMQTIGNTLSKDQMQSAPLLDPPIATGLAESVNKIYDIIMKHGPVSRDEWKQVRIEFTLGKI